MTFCPADVGTGIAFKRIDLPGQPLIPAHIDYVCDTARSTTIGVDKKIFDRHDYSNSCMIGDIGKGSTALVVTLPAERGLTPNEMHVFESLTHKLPLYVAASDDRIWAVEGERIRLVDQSEKETKSSTTPPSKSN